MGTNIHDWINAKDDLVKTFKRPKSFAKIFNALGGYAQTKFKCVLVLVGLNGVILNKSQGEQLEIKKKCHFEEDFDHYFRPGYEKFLLSLVQHPNVLLGLHCNVSKKKLRGLVNKMF